MNPYAFFFTFSHHVNGFASKGIALTVDVLQDRKIYCLQARPCIFQPGNVTGWGSEGVKVVLNWANCYPSFLNWLIMRCKLRPELAAEAQQTA